MRLERILAAVDDSPGGGDALRVAVALAKAAPAALRVLTVAEDQESRPVAAVRALITAETTGIAIEHVVRAGVAAVEIPREADVYTASLIVLGRCPVDGARPRALGRTLEGSVRRAAVPSLIVASGASPYGRVLAAVDGGPASTEILQAAFGMARFGTGGVVALHVQRLATDSGSGVSELVAATAPAGSDRQVLCRAGDPAAEIRRAAREDGIRLLVIGCRRGAVAGDAETVSVTPRVLRQVPCAVLTVPV